MVDGIEDGRPGGATSRLPRRLWQWLAVSAASTLGGGVVTIALAWSAAGLGGRITGWITALTALPTVLLVLVGGAVGDRLGQRLILLYTTIASIAQYALFLAMVEMGVPLVALLCANALVAGTLAGIAGPSSTVYARQFVDSDQVPRAIALANTVGLVARLLAPALGGVIVGRAGLTGGLWMNLAVSVAILAALLGLKPAPARIPSTIRNKLHTDIFAGLSGLAHDRRLVTLLASLLIVAGGVLPISSLSLPLVARERGWSVSSLGLVEAAWSAGALLSSVIIARQGPARRPIIPMVVGTAVASGACLALAYHATPELAMISAAIIGVGVGTYTGHVSPVFIHLTPNDAMSRFSSILYLAQVIPVLAAGPILGELSQSIGASATLTLLGVTILAAPVILLSFSSTRSIDLSIPQNTIALSKVRSDAASGETHEEVAQGS